MNCAHYHKNICGEKNVNRFVNHSKCTCNNLLIVLFVGTLINNIKVYQLLNLGGFGTTLAFDMRLRISKPDEHSAAIASSSFCCTRSDSLM